VPVTPINPYVEVVEVVEVLPSVYEKIWRLKNSDRRRKNLHNLNDLNIGN